MMIRAGWIPDDTSHTAGVQASINMAMKTVDEHGTNSGSGPGLTGHWGLARIGTRQVLVCPLLGVNHENPDGSPVESNTWRAVDSPVYNSVWINDDALAISVSPIEEGGNLLDCTPWLQLKTM